MAIIQTKTSLESFKSREILGGSCRYCNENGITNINDIMTLNLTKACH